MRTPQRIYLSVSNDVVTDQRVGRVARTLLRSGKEVRVIGRLLPGSLPATGFPYRVVRFRLPFRRGFFFYASLNTWLFIYLLFAKRGMLVANDLDTLLPNYLVSRLRGLPLVYDSHEYFLGVPEIRDRRWVRRVWRWIEKHTVPRIPLKITVNHSIAGLYRADYDTGFEVVRNMAPRFSRQGLPGREELHLPSNRPLLVFQGAGINRDRGGEELVRCMAYLPEALLLIIGSGDVLPLLKQLTRELGLEDRIRFLGKMPYRKMMEYTCQADLGLSLDRDTSLNQRYSLPNKLFDYIQAGIPVLASDLPEVRELVLGYEIGELLRLHEPREMAEQIRAILADPERLKTWHEKLEKAARELSWEKEEEILIRVYEKAGLSF